ncbi:MAG: hypothetical protein LBI64_02485, partial [Coriobacteriales bacterium]|nr:hypothetical protein [Coriobacteriales bacterium]
MRNVLALTKRILQQFSHDHRTLALLLGAPILALWLFSVLLGSPAYTPTLATIGLPDELNEALEAEGAQLIVFDDLVPAADELLATQEVDALLWIADGTLT